MPIALLFALALAQSAPSGAAQGSASSPEDIAAGGASNLPKDDYGLVAWCHGALAGQLELDPIAHADMIAIEGKAKVEARAKSDAEMAKDRREYLHEYERALAAAEKASPVAIHEYGVTSELAGYKLWGATRQKQPIWRMLDWGMWDPNDAGCGDAAKRLYNKSSLFGEALKGSGDEKAAQAKGEAETPQISLKSYDAPAPNAEAPAPAAAAPAETVSGAPAAASTEAAPEPKSAPVKAKPVKTRTAKVAKPKTKAAETAPVADAASPAPDPAAATPPAADQAAPPADGPLRGPQI